MFDDIELNRGGNEHMCINGAQQVTDFNQEKLNFPQQQQGATAVASASCAPLAWVGEGGVEALDTLQERLEAAATTMKATTAAVRNKTKCKVVDDLREMARGGKSAEIQSRDMYSGNGRGRRRGNLMPEWGSSPRGSVGKTHCEATLDQWESERRQSGVDGGDEGSL